MYSCIEDLHRVYLDMMATYYGKRYVDIEPPEQVTQLYQFAMQPVPEKVPMEFDFSVLRTHPMTMKLDVGASSYYSEIASINTLDNLLRDGHIDVLQYLERIPDGYVPGRRSLIADIQRQRQQAQMMQIPGMLPMGGGEVMPSPTGGDIADQNEKAEIPTGGGFSAMQRAIVGSGESRQFI